MGEYHVQDFGYGELLFFSSDSFVFFERINKICSLNQQLLWLGSLMQEFKV